MPILSVDLKIKLSLTALIIISCYGAFAQSIDTVYLDGSRKKTQKEQSTYYRVLVKTNDSIYTCKDYWRSGEISMQGQLSSLYPETKEGRFVWYYKAGPVSQIINYSNGIETGLIQTYDLNGNIDAEYCANLDSLDNGAEVKRAINSFWHYASRNLKYPKEDIIVETEGTVRAEFFLNREGKIERLKIWKSVSPKIDKEAMRIIQSFNKWPAPLYKGKRTMLLYVLPIVFQLE
jgi:TonB family protein